MKRERFLLPILFLMIAYPSFAQSKEEIKEKLKTTDLEDNNALTALLKDVAFEQLCTFSTAISDKDYKTVYYYFNKSEINGQSEKEFIKECKIAEKEAFSDLKSTVIIAKKPKEVVHCSNGFFCQMFQTTTQVFDTNTIQFDSRILGFSEDGINWVFLNAGRPENEFNNSRYPEVCDELFE